MMQCVLENALLHFIHFSPEIQFWSTAGPNINIKGERSPKLTYTFYPFS